MKIRAIAIATFLIALLMMVSVSVQAECCCQAWGLTPGFWLGGKGYDLWPADYSHDQTVGSIFDVSDPTIAAMTLDQVLGYGGSDMRIKLLRNGVAALLNDASNYGAAGTFASYQYYPLDEYWIKWYVDNGLKQPKAIMEMVKDYLESLNTLGN